VKYELLFRASENDFKASVFHEKCDYVEGTFTLVRTEFDKTNGDFSHYSWNSVNVGYVHDEKRRSFMLSFDWKEKYVSQSGHKQIYCSPNYGPVFGGGQDVCIADNCYGSTNSYSSFSTTYN
jgi:hypothetical protein